MADEIPVPQFILMLRGTPSTKTPGNWNVEVKGFDNLDDFKAFAEKENFPEVRFLGVFRLGDRVDVGIGQKTIEVVQREVTIPAE